MEVMREILFRGKRLDNGVWITGGYHGSCGRHFIFPLPIVPPRIQVDPSTVGQFTGLLDTNGKRIFEGDELLVIRHKGDFKYNCVVMDIRNLPELMFGSSVESIEVIGNIHDNPELLKGGDTDG